MEKSKIVNGEDFEFGNDRVMGCLTWSEKVGKFMIFFNGVCLAAYKTFNAAKNRTERLMNNWHMKATCSE